MSDGMGYMINALAGRSEAEVAVYKSAQGKIIKNAELLDGKDEGFEDGALVLTFEDDSVLSVYDNGRSCCESRYIKCDDPLEQFVGAKFLEIEIRPADPVEEVKTSDWDTDEHEQIFVVVKTDRGNITLNAHNEHNGYYGGFFVRVSDERKHKYL